MNLGEYGWTSCKCGGGATELLGVFHAQSGNGTQEKKTGNRWSGFAANKKTRQGTSGQIYRRMESGKLRRLSTRELAHKSNEALLKYYHWLEDGLIEHVFESSSRFCEELAARAQPKIPDTRILKLTSKEHGILQAK